METLELISEPDLDLDLDKILYLFKHENAPNTSSQEIGATVLAKGTNVNNSYRQYGMYLNEDSGQLAWSWSISTQTGETSIYSSNVAEIFEWTHLVGTYGGSVTSLYVNGCS